MAFDEDRPVLTGLLALVGVGLVVGLVVGVAAASGSSVLGLGGESSDGSTSVSDGSSMYLPEPVATSDASDPLLTFSADPTPSRTASRRPTPTPSASPTKKEITLQVGNTQVSPMDRIDLSGVYPGGEGAIVEVQRYENEQWVFFVATASVSGETFSTYVQTGVPGPNKFRVVDTDTGLASNEVTVTVG